MKMLHFPYTITIFSIDIRIRHIEVSILDYSYRISYFKNFLLMYDYVDIPLLKNIGLRNFVNENLIQDYSEYFEEL